MSDLEDTESSTELPDRCPICNKKKINILLHIKTRRTCYEKVDKDSLERWRKIARKETKRKYQTKFNERGGHNKAREVRRLAGECLVSLSQGKTPRIYIMKNYDLVATLPLTIKWVEGISEEKCLLNEEEWYAWLKNVSSKALEAIMSLQLVILVPESDWIIATKTIEENPDHKVLKEKLFTLIGKLKAYDHENTRKLSIPEKYNSVSKETTRWKHYPCFNNNIFTKEDENQLIHLIEDILGYEVSLLDKELQDLLKITEKMENLIVALCLLCL